MPRAVHGRAASPARAALGRGPVLRGAAGPDGRGRASGGSSSSSPTARRPRAWSPSRPAAAGSQATTTVEMVRAGGELRLYNSRRSAATTDAARGRRADRCALPGGGAGRAVGAQGRRSTGSAFDLRVVVIGGAGRARRRPDEPEPDDEPAPAEPPGRPRAVRSRMAAEAWEAAMRACERAAAVFAGLPVRGRRPVIAAGFRRHAVLEVNAFGDLLPGVTSRGHGHLRGRGRRPASDRGRGRMIRAIFFDLDGTLIDRGAAHRRYCLRLDGPTPRAPSPADRPDDRRCLLSGQVDEPGLGSPRVRPGGRPGVPGRSA